MSWANAWLLSAAWVAGGSVFASGFPARNDHQAPAELQRWLQPQSWVRDRNEPVLALGRTGEFDHMHIFAPCVERDADQFRLWYCGSRGKVEERVFELGLALGRDGRQFEKYDGNPVLRFGDGKHSILTPTILRDDSKWRMWFAATDFINGKGLHTLHECASDDGIRWSSPSAPLLSNVYAPTIVKADGEYRMWFTRVGQNPWVICHAVSPDGRAWKVSPAPVLELDQPWELDRLFYPTVVQQDGVYLMWYGSYWKDAKPDQKTALGFAVSTDGITWHKHPANPVFRPEPKHDWESHYVTSQSVMRLPDGSWRIWYASRTKPPFTHKYFAIGTATWTGPRGVATDDTSTLDSRSGPAGHVAASEKTVNSRDELVAALRDAKPGDVIRVAAGTYRGGIELRGINGTPSAPVRLIAADAKKPPVFEGGGSGLHVTQCSFLVIDGLHLRGASGNGLNVDEGGAERPASPGIVLRNLVVTDVGPKGNRDGIKLSGLDDFAVANCRVERWGTGGSGIDMVGCHDGVISGCVFQRDPADKEGLQQSSGVQMKGGSARIVVRRCLFKNAGGRAVNLGGSTGKEYFRPPGADHEARDLTVEDCQFIGGMTPVAFVGVDRATVRYNTIYHPGRWALRILQESRGPEFVPSRNGVFTNNLVVFRSDEMVEAVNIGPGTSPESFTFADNAWFCDDRPEQSQRRVRLPVAEKNGTYGVNPRLADPAHDRLDLLSDSPVKNAGVRTKSPIP